MRLVTYSAGPAGPPRAGVRVGHRILDIEAASRVNGEPLPSSVKALLAAGRGALARVQALAKAATTEARPFTKDMYEERAIRFLPPVPDADRLLCMGRVETAKAAAGDIAASRMPSSRLLGHNAKAALPEGAVGLDCAPAMVFVIGRHAQDVDRDDASDYVAGVTLLNQFTGRDSKKREIDARARARDGNEAPGFGSLGSDIVTLDEIADLDDLWMICTVNGEERLRGNTHDQAWTMPDIVEHFSRVGPLEAGDMISIGAPAGATEGKPGAAGLFLEPGDVVEFTIEGIAALRTTIVAAGEA